MRKGLLMAWHFWPVTVLLPTLLAQIARGNGLENAGFEEGLRGWSVHVYGAQPQVQGDSQIRHGGRQALRIQASQPTDTALGQEVQLVPRQWYRFRGWVKTHQLTPKDGTVFGTFQIQHTGGKGVIAGGVNHCGDSDWTEVSISFQAPTEGRTRIAVFFVGYGKGTGTAWFDDLSLEKIDVSTAVIKVTPTPLVDAEISPYQYGQFIEYLCDLVPGMWAEKLSDGSFEGLSPYKVAFRRQTDFKERPWYPSGAVNRAEYTLDRTTAISGQVSQRIRVAGGAPCTVGMAQDGIALERGKACQLSCYLRHEGGQESVNVRLHRDEQLLATCDFQPKREWQKFQARLIPAATSIDATLTISFRGPGTLWIDNASLMPEDTVGGWRPDVVAALKALKPGVIRFGGSALDDPNLGEFEWRDTVGNPDRRPPFRAWGGLQPTGPGLEEIIQLCRAVGAEPILCVRVERRTPKDAADEVEYLNGSADTPMGKLRAQNGHREPYRVRFWQIGNERAGSAYEARLAEFAQAMRKVDPTIKLLSSYPSAGVLRRAGTVLDYVCPHHYNIADLAGAERDLLAVRDLIHRYAPGRSIRVAVTEWNTTGGDWGLRRARLWTLDNALACARYHNLLHRHCDLVKIANRSNLTNSFCSGILQTDNHRMYQTPTYYAQQLYATRGGTRPLKMESDLPPKMGLDVSAMLTRDGRTAVLFAVNDTLQDITRPLDFSALGTAGQDVTIHTLTDRKRAGEPDVTNSFAEPQRVSTKTATLKVSQPRFAYRFPALSLTVLEWPLPEDSPAPSSY
jgi:alpha-N-arabinofuranosidase